MTRKILATPVAALLFVTGAAAGWAQDAAEIVATAAPLPNPGNTTWMMTATILVLAMIEPGLALFYGGMVRAKNILFGAAAVPDDLRSRDADLGGRRSDA